ncbi:hypothetical protein EXN66_Car007205 [Channa argus]|uniref:Uncharacterized protein n=1 Tax=Channa argus TaxID=215402 RepID=A0A6G1PMJ7_CHAAH|nr:hypothetical protein EXN66_Car007205 [Channa argus]
MNRSTKSNDKALARSVGPVAAHCKTHRPKAGDTCRKRQRGGNGGQLRNYRRKNIKSCSGDCVRGERDMRRKGAHCIGGVGPPSSLSL